ncbi:MAG: cyclic 2,3-diphosphoglycerate synthase [Sulfolobales archaeon]|nr:cyclic 2,3-diphosphoglycerate synthase [Sulfolobales archaeon]MDW8082395.1 cyclic 2,3-diphosphoglycerate synthase [Sulfolobales archaeon]
MVKRVVIAGAGGRDFHNFLVYFRDNPEYEVVAFTATQIPGIERRRFPPELAGPRYPQGVPVYPESELPKLLRDLKVDEVILSYSDLTYQDVGKLASIVLSAGASFRLLSPFETFLKSYKPVIAVTAVRTGAGKSTVSRAVTRELLKTGIKVVPIRHPMAYGDLVKSAVQIFRSEEDFAKYGITIEEREEYEQYIRLGLPVLAGVDYGRILLEAEKLGDVLLWDGGNNDTPFIKFDYMITVADAMRPGQEVLAYPGEVNARLADAVVINKISRSNRESVKRVVSNIEKINPKAKIVLADMEVTVEKPELIRNKRIAVVEDSPSVTHGGLPYGAGFVAAEKYGAAEIVDPRPHAVGVIKTMIDEYPHMGPVVPSTGYTLEQIRDLNETLRKMNVDAVVLGTPADISGLLDIDVPIVKVLWELKVLEGPTISELVREFLARVGLV